MIPYDRPFQEVPMLPLKGRAWLATSFAAMVFAFTFLSAGSHAQGRRAFSFRVEVDGVSLGNFKSVSGLSTETEVIEFRDGGSDVIRKLPGLTKYSNVKLTRAFTGDTTLY